MTIAWKEVMKQIRKTDHHGNYVANLVGFVCKSSRGEIRYQRLVRRLFEHKEMTEEQRFGNEHYVNENPEYIDVKMGEKETKESTYSIPMQDAETGAFVSIPMYAIVHFNEKRVLYPKIEEGVEKYPKIECGVAYWS